MFYPRDFQPAGPVLADVIPIRAGGIPDVVPARAVGGLEVCRRSRIRLSGVTVLDAYVRGGRRSPSVRRWNFNAGLTEHPDIQKRREAIAAAAGTGPKDAA